MKDFVKVSSLREGVSFPDVMDRKDKDEYVDICLSIWGSVVRDYEWAVSSGIYLNEVKRRISGDLTTENATF